MIYLNNINLETFLQNQPKLTVHIMELPIYSR